MFKQSAVVILLFVLISSLASGATIYLGTFSGNDSEAAVEAAILASTGTSIDLTLYDKSDESPVLTTFTPNPSGVELSGTWDVLDDAVLISFLTVKASDLFAVYGYNPAVNSGAWSTADIVNGGGQQPGASHISLWTSDVLVVPEPGTFGLLGLSLMAAGILRRRIRVN